MRAKPFSIQHRIILIQATGFALALWFLAGTLYVNVRVDRELKESLRSLESELRIHAELSSTLVSLRKLVRLENPPLAAHSPVGVEGLLQTLSNLVHEYSELGPRGPDPRWRKAVERASGSVIAETHAILADRTPRTAADFQARERRLEEFCDQMGALVGSRAEEQLNALSISRGRLERYTLALTLLFLTIGLTGTLVLVQARRVFQRQIWEPLEALRRMVLEVRGGNLTISAAVPQNLEFGTLVSGFLDMAGALRKMRESLELKVKERTASLEAAQRELIQAAKLSSLGLLVSGVAHEINNPLTSILGFSELALARKDLDARLRNPLETIRQEALRLKSLVSNLSTYYRRGPQRTERVDLRLVLDQVVELRRYQLMAINIQLHYRRPLEPAWVEGDADQLVQVLFNLVLNAQQAMTGFREGGDIWISCGAAPQGAYVTVRDNGIGIPAANLDSIFDPFFTTMPVGQGTGLGLSISHGIIQRHGGTITVASEEGRGTTMRIALPAASAPRTAPDVALPAAAPGGERAAPGVQSATARPRHALILDDEPGVAEFVKEGLEARGWTAEAFPAADNLETLIEGRNIDLLVCDLRMPGRNGLEVLRLLREKWPRLAERFLLMTGNLSDADEAAHHELAGIPILRKPFTLRQFEEAIHAVLHKPA